MLEGQTEPLFQQALAISQGWSPKSRLLQADPVTTNSTKHHQYCLLSHSYAEIIHVTDPGHLPPDRLLVSLLA